MSAASAKRPVSSAKGAGRTPAKRPIRATSGPRVVKAKIPAAPEAFDGPGYQFAGFRMMCRHRHIRH